MKQFQERPLDEILSPSEIERAKLIYGAYGKSRLNSFESVLRQDIPRLSVADAFAVEYHLMHGNMPPRKKS